jgi:hypothetical protein
MLIVSMQMLRPRTLGRRIKRVEGYFALPTQAEGATLRPDARSGQPSREF